MKSKFNHEYRAKRHKVRSEFGYGIMWLFLGALVEELYFLNEIQMSLYHIVAGVTVLVACYKFYKGIAKKRKQH